MYDIWIFVYWKFLPYTQIPIRDICPFPYFTLERSGFFYQSTIIDFKPQDILTFIFNRDFCYHACILLNFSISVYTRRKPPPVL